MNAKKPLRLVVFTVMLLALALVLPAVARAEEPLRFDLNPWVWLGSSGPDSVADANPWITDPIDGLGKSRLPSASAGDHVFASYIWFGIGRGRMQSAPSATLTGLEVWKQTATPGTHEGTPWLTITPKEAKAYWLSPVLVEGLEDILKPFNPHIGAKLYKNSWEKELNELPDVATLPAGNYTVHFTWDQSHVVVDLFWSYEGQHKPTPWRPGDPLISGDSWFWFTVTP